MPSETSDGPDALRLGALGAANGGVLDPLVLLQAAVAVSLNRGVVDEDIRRTVVGGDEAIALVRVEPLHCSLSHCVLLWNDHQDPLVCVLGCAVACPSAWRELGTQAPLSESAGAVTRTRTSTTTSSYLTPPHALIRHFEDNRTRRPRG